MLEAQLRHYLKPYSSKFTMLSFSVLGSAGPDVDNQNGATTTFRVFAQAKIAADLAPQKFLRPIIDNIMQGYPGATFHLGKALFYPRLFLLAVFCLLLHLLTMRSLP